MTADSRKSPSPQEICAARKASGCSQSEAAALVYTTTRSWQTWESGQYKMHPAIYELFLIKTDKAIDP